MDEGRLNLKVDGMTCNHCASTVSGIIKQEGGKSIHVDYLMGEASFDLSNTAKLDKITKRLVGAGYPASSPDHTVDGSEKTSGLSSIEKKFLFTLPFSLVLFSHMFFPHSWLINNSWVQLGLCLPVFILGFYHFGKSTFEAIKSGHINMDVLILLGSSSAFGYSLYGAIAYAESSMAHQYLFFETTSTIITLVLLGYVIEHRAVQKTTTNLRDLYNAKPQKAKKLVQQGHNQNLVVVDSNALQPNDLVLVNTGDQIPADGTLIHGNLVVNEAMLTGEAEHIQKSKGDEVYSGSVIIDGNGTLSVTKAGAQSTIGKIIELVKQSRSDKPAIQKLADKISSWFVPAILGLAAATFFFNFYLIETDLSDAMLRSVAVLVIACPCAMGLATPTAVSVGLGMAARHGIILKKASVFEEIKAVDTFVFDKTGTLTSGELEILLNQVSDRYELEAIWRIVKTLEARSNHPLSKSFLELTNHLEEIEMTEIEEHKGKGISGKFDGKLFRLGNPEFVSEKSDEPGDILLTMDGEFLASFSVKDTIKKESASVISYLLSKRKKLVLLSGDNEEKTSAVANQVGIKTYKSRQLPEEKLAELNRIKKTTKVAMIGDGINDAPALATADIGISIGNSNALAAESAKAVIIGTKIELIKKLYEISEKVVVTIKQNLFWAFAYNLVAIPLAALGYLDPMVAALSMAFSDVVVIGNSLRLRLTLSSASY